MSVWQFFTRQSKQTRLYLGLGALAWGTVGLYLSDEAEKKLGLEATEKDREALKSALPHVTVVDRNN